MEVAKSYEIYGKSLEDYGKVLVNLTRKSFPDDVGEERKQVLRSTKGGLT